MVVGILAVYTTVLVRGSTESSRRVLELKDEASASDRVGVSVPVTDVNPPARELIAQLTFRLAAGNGRMGHQQYRSRQSE